MATRPDPARPDDGVVEAQSGSHGAGFDYTPGSPHLAHAGLRSRVEQRLGDLVRATTGVDGCHVLEIGAGHGTFTDVLLAAGARVTVSEVSAASAGHLEQRFAGDERVRVLHDQSGTEVLELGDTFDAVVVISVLHHIPDYRSFVERVSARIRPGGSFFSVQDPIWYARRTRAAHVASRGTYFTWRLTQGEVRRGLATRVRRLRGVYDESQPSDLVEYHVVRDGVDEEALVATLEQLFGSVDLFRYWSTQPGWGQRLGERAGWLTEFGLVAHDRRGSAI